MDEICEKDGMKKYRGSSEWKLKIWPFLSDDGLKTFICAEGLSRGYVVEMISAVVVYFVLVIFIDL